MDDTDRSTGPDDERRARMEALRALRGGEDAALDDGVRLFGSEEQLLLAVYHQWQVALLARLDQVLENGADDVHDAVLRAVAEQSRAMPGFAALLSEHADDPVLDRARQRLSGYVGQACPCGRPHPLVARPIHRRATAGRTMRQVRALAARWRQRLAAAGGPCPVTGVGLRRI
jgi:AcrR family transcriptional regulator